MSSIKYQLEILKIHVLNVERSNNFLESIKYNIIPPEPEVDNKEKSDFNTTGILSDIEYLNFRLEKAIAAQHKAIEKINNALFEINEKSNDRGVPDYTQGGMLPKSEYKCPDFRG